METDAFIGHVESMGCTSIVPPSSIKVPNNVEEALQSPNSRDWKLAMEKELQSLKAHQVADLVPESEVPESSRIIGTRWIFRVKADGLFKARLVVKGYNQRVGIDCGETYASVCA